VRTRSVVGGAWAVALCFAGIALPAEELTPVRAFRSFTSPELPESIVTDLLQDADGVLWIATISGLASYEGTSVRAVKEVDAPRGVSMLASRRAGGLYVLSRRGVHVYDGRWLPVKTESAVRSIAEEDGRWLWAIRGETAWRTASASPGTEWERVALPAEAGRPVALRSDGADGIYVFVEVTGGRRAVHCRQGHCEPVAGASSLPDDLTAVLPTRDGALWLGTAGGEVLTTSRGSAGWTAVDAGPWASDGVRSLAEDTSGQVWAGGFERLCHGTRTGAWSCWGAENGLPSSAILSILADREGTLWLGLNGSGLRQWVGRAWTHRTRWPGDVAAREGLDVIGVAATPDGSIAASVYGRGILHWDGRALRTFGAREGLDADVRALVFPAPGVMWAGTRRGIYEQEGGRFRRALDIPGFVSGFAQDGAGRWHAFTEGHGIYRRGSSWVLATELEELAPRAGVRALLWTASGETWIATGSELVTRRPGAAVERHRLGLEHGLPDTVSALLEAGPDETWAGGQGGLAILKAGTRRLLTEHDGVPGNVYFLRKAPDGAVWVGGSRGIARVEGGRFTTWDRRRGLLGDECNGGAALLPDGTLFAATGGSLARYDPRVSSAPLPPLRLGWRGPAAARLGSAVELPASDRRLQVSWSAPWLGPQDVEYSTRVGQGHWSPPTRETHLTLESLPPGETGLAVRARRAGEDWSDPIVLRVRASPRLSETAWARGLVVLAAGALMAAAAHLHARRRHARREQALLSLRADFIASASHELRTPIAQIRLFADMLRLGRVRDPAERDDALATIHRATTRLESLSANLLELAQGVTPTEPASAEVPVGAILEETVQDLSALAAARQASVQLETAPGLRAGVDPETLRRVVSNLVDNALKYGPPGQVVRVSAGADPTGLLLLVEDDGPGIPPEDRERVFERFTRLERDRASAVSGTGLGLAVVREAVSRAGGAVRVEDASPEGGTRVVVTLPPAASA
jgi:signal transduction histidine kinase/ligand-binding sensor domain-containing protein